MLKCQNANKVKKIIAKLILFSIAINLNITLLFAYLNNGQILININRYNEAQIEIIIVPLLTIWTIWQIIKKDK